MIIVITADFRRCRRRAGDGRNAKNAGRGPVTRARTGDGLRATAAAAGGRNDLSAAAVSPSMNATRPRRSRPRVTDVLLRARAVADRKHRR